MGVCFILASSDLGTLNSHSSSWAFICNVICFLDLQQSKTGSQHSRYAWHS